MSHGHALATIVLAAGASERLGQCKQLVEFDGEPLVRRSARLALSLTDQVVVVVGASADLVVDRLADLSVNVVINGNWSQGMGGSLALGVQSLPATAAAVLILTCDQYRITADDLSRLIQAWRPNPGVTAVAAYDGIRGVPAIFPESWYPALASLGGDRGARSLLRDANHVTDVPMPHAAVDLDHPADLQRLNAER